MSAPAAARVTAVDAFAEQAEALADWVDKHLVNRRDAYGGYYRKDGATHQTTRKATDKAGPLSLKTLRRHFRATGTDAVVGLHSTYRDDAGECWSRWLALDIDRHDDDDDPEANLRAALGWYAAATALGFTPLLLDSNGRGGYHLIIVFAAPVPTRLVFTFGQWLIRDWESRGLAKPPETFPKQVGISVGGYGNWLRVFGRHHTREHWTRFWSGAEWLDGAAACQAILAIEGSPEELIPAEARPNPDAPNELAREIERKQARAAAGRSGEPAKRAAVTDGTTLPGDDFNARAKWRDILPAGWVLDHESEGTEFWRRPGKSAGHSATINHNGNNTFYVFTDAAAPFVQDGSYDKFGAFAAVNHNGDTKAAARALSRQGYGTFATWVKVDGQWKLEIRPNPCPKGVRVAKPGEGPPAELAWGRAPASNGQHAAQPSTNGAGRHGGKHPTNGAAAAAPANPRADVEITTRRHEVVAETIAALRDDPALYFRGDALVSVAAETEDTAELTGWTTLSQVKGSPKILMLAEAVVGCVLTRNARFYQWKTVNKEEYAADVHPPEWLIKAVANHKTWPGVRPLLTIAEAPFPRPDGSIVETPGYDTATGTLYVPAMRFPAVPEHPTKDDAAAAWERLKMPVREFPFESDNDRAVWLASLLTAVARPSIPGPVPGIAVNGNKAGIGKGLLIDVAGIIAHGRNIPTSGYPFDREEAEKVKLAIALSGRTAVHFDNLDEGSTYGNSALDSALTSDTVNGRILSTSRESGDLPLRTTWFLSGNNIAPGKDAFRRWLPCNLVTPLESPEERSDIEDRNLRATVLAKRGALVRDALTILRAHALAGRPTGEWAPLGSFEAWDTIIRGAVWFATGLDCGETRRRAAEDSDDRQRKLALLNGWRELPGGGDDGSGVTAARAVEMANATDVDGPKYNCPILRNALAAYGKDGKPATPGQVGNRIRAMKNTVIGGLKFVNAGLEHQAVQWKVVRVSPLGETGESGESDFPGNAEGAPSLNYVNTSETTPPRNGDGRKPHSPDSPVSPRTDWARNDIACWLTGFLDTTPIPFSTVRKCALQDGVLRPADSRDAESKPLLDAANLLPIARDKSNPKQTLWSLPKLPPCGITTEAQGERMDEMFRRGKAARESVPF